MLKILQVQLFPFGRLLLMFFLFHFSPFALNHKTKLRDYKLLHFREKKFQSKKSSPISSIRAQPSQDKRL